MVNNGESWLNMVNNWNNVGKTMSQTTHDWVLSFGDGENITYENADDWGIVYLCLTHIDIMELCALSTVI